MADSMPDPNNIWATEIPTRRWRAGGTFKVHHGLGAAMAGIAYHKGKDGFRARLFKLVPDDTDALLAWELDREWGNWDA